MTDEQDKLDTIIELIEATEGADMFLSSKSLLEKIRCIATGEEIKMTETTRKPLDHIIISCDASIKVNPGGPASIGVVIQVPGKEKNLEIAQITADKTNNQAEYNAIYTGLMTLCNLNNHMNYEIEVRSDSQLAIKQIKGEIVCNDEKLANKRDAIRELAAALPMPVKWTWRPRCSTQELMEANYLCQDVLGVPRH